MPCGVCLKGDGHMYTAPCGHIFHRPCLEECSGLEEGGDASPDSIDARCPRCGEAFCLAQLDPTPLDASAAQSTKMKMKSRPTVSGSPLSLHSFSPGGSPLSPSSVGSRQRERERRGSVLSPSRKGDVHLDLEEDAEVEDEEYADDAGKHSMAQDTDPYKMCDPEDMGLSKVARVLAVRLVRRLSPTRVAWALGVVCAVCAAWHVYRHRPPVALTATLLNGGSIAAALAAFMAVPGVLKTTRFTYPIQVVERVQDLFDGDYTDNPLDPIRLITGVLDRFSLHTPAKVTCGLLVAVFCPPVYLAMGLGGGVTLVWGVLVGSVLAEVAGDRIGNTLGWYAPLRSADTWTLLLAVALYIACGFRTGNVDREYVLTSAAVLVGACLFFTGGSTAPVAVSWHSLPGLALSWATALTRTVADETLFSGLLYPGITRLLDGLPVWYAQGETEGLTQLSPAGCVGAGLTALVRSLRGGTDPLTGQGVRLLNRVKAGLLGLALSSLPGGPTHPDTYTDPPSLSLSILGGLIVYPLSHRMPWYLIGAWEAGMGAILAGFLVGSEMLDGWLAL
ncbi:hypothetical protein KIPB_007543 [Kipferlia bialata]|uniref:RING-type domain-containing protein n=1 Tax=Kipferlia bialata TaxID=797122 RepID=A0A9K3GK46_9EUKA|nr:hypothetical protein KIPB_007543 [Kipferlia bialata]|eukprot:g7543.t1